MIKRNLFFLSVGAIASISLFVSAVALSHSVPAPSAVRGTTYELVLSKDNGKINATSSVETTSTSSRTSAGATFTFKHKGLSASNNAFASFASGGYLLTPNGVNGLSSVSASVASGKLYVSFALSDRKADNSALVKGDGDWTYKQDLSSPVNAPVGMHYVKIFAETATVVNSITFNYDCTGVASPDTNIRVYVPTTTSHTHIWAWDNGGNQFATWPGAAMSTSGNWKTYTFSDKSSMNVIFSHNEGNDKTSDLFVSGYGDHYYYNDHWYGYDPLSVEPEEPEEGAIDTIYFTNNKGWSSVYCYAWNAQGNNGNWPGKSMSFVYTNNGGEDVYKITGMSSYTYLIFTNNDGKQTVNIPAPTTQNAYYLLDTTDGEGHFYVGQWNEEGGVHLADSSKGLKILHCFDWSVPNITARIDEIAAAGYTAVQTMPLQPVKDFSDGQNDTHYQWWRLYQPLGFKVAGVTNYKRENLIVNGDSELQALTAAARAKGIRVIVDVVCNHLAGGGSDHRNLNPQVSDFESAIYNGWSSTTHDNNGAKVSYDSAWNITQNNFGDCIDLNTSNSTVQGRVLAYLKELIDDGVTGFRFDAAKHIETKYDTNCGSSFWENTLGAAKAYAATKGESIFAYGEILNGIEAGRRYTQYINDAYFDAVTPNWTSQCWRNGIMSGYNDSSFSSELSAGHNNVTWGESHDEYAGDNYNSVTSGTDQSVINNAYAVLASRSGLHTLYYDRPDNKNAAMGTPSSSKVWACDFIKGANKFHNELLVASEYLGKTGNASFVIRHGSGNGLAFVNPNCNQITISNGNLANGTYRNVLTGATINISGNSYSTNEGWGYYVKQ